MIGIVAKSNAHTRKIDVVGGTNAVGLLVPSYLPMPAPGGEVYYDEVGYMVISVIKIYPDRKSDETIANYPETKSGEQVVGIPGQGFIGFFRNLKTLVGATLNNYIQFDGASNTIRAFGEKFEVVGGNNMSVSLSAPADPLGMPIFDVKLGDALTLNISASQSKLIMDLFGLVSAGISEEGVQLIVTNPITGKRTYIIDENFQDKDIGSSTGQDQLYSLSANFVADMGKVTMDASGPVKISTPNLSLVGAKGASISSENVVFVAGKKMKLTAPTFMFEVGDASVPGAYKMGNFFINNGLGAHIKMSDRGDIKLGTSGSIILSGIDDNVCNATAVSSAIDTIFNYLVGLNSALAATPAAGFAGPQAPILTKGQIMAKLPKIGITNESVFIGKFPSIATDK